MATAPVSITQASNQESKTAAEAKSPVTAGDITKLGLQTINPTDLFKGILDKASQVADKGVLATLNTVGIALPFVALFLKLRRWDGTPLVNLEGREFGYVLLLSGVCFIASVSARSFTYYCEYTLEREMLKARIDVLHASAAITEKGLQVTADIAKSNSEIAAKAPVVGVHFPKVLDELEKPKLKTEPF